MAQSRKSSARSTRSQKRRKSQIRLVIAIVVVGIGLGAIIIALSLVSGTAGAAVESDYSSFAQEIDESGVGLGFALGSPDAPVTLVDYSDFSCGHCSNLADMVDVLIDEYVATGELRIIFKPLSFVSPPYSSSAAQAAVCAAYQGKFWEMHDQLWAAYEVSGPGIYTQRSLAQFADNAGLDADEFRACYSDPQTVTEVQNLLAEAQQVGITGTPTVYINGEPFTYRGVETGLADLRSAIEAELANQ